MTVRSTWLAMILITSISPVFAQNKSETSLEDKHTRVLFFPEFYHDAVRNGDTTLKYECYDEHDGRIRMDTLQNTDAIEELFYMASFFDRRYTVGKGISQPYMTNKIAMYIKVAPYSWAATDVAAAHTTELKGDLAKIVRTDTLLTTAATNGRSILTIRKYYKVSEVPESQRHEVVHKHR